MADPVLKGAKASKNNRKHGRSALSPSMCRYRAEERWTKNKHRRVTTHLHNHPNDSQAKRWLGL
jgi:hypothetical protein